MVDAKGNRPEKKRVGGNLLFFAVPARLSMRRRAFLLECKAREQHFVEKEDETMQLDARPVREKIRAAAVQLFAEMGYHAAPLRDIASLAGIQAASIYYHYPSKQALLVEIMDTYMRQLNSYLEEILARPTNVAERLYEAIASHIRLHTTYKAEFFIIDTEIRALEGENRANILALRDRYEHLLQRLLQEGIEQRILRPTDVKVTSYAIIAMCTEVSSWFRSPGRLTVQQVVEIYSQLIAQGLLLSAEPAQTQEESARI
jgi:AcrR family transcriptional regulator